jgi:hypothetical protein
MIRLATRSDISAIAELLEEFLLETDYAEHCEEIDHEYMKRLVFAVLHQGYIWLLCHDDVVVGCLIAVREQNIWMPKKVSLREMVWYVKEPYRKTLGAGRLFVKFCEKGDELMARGDIQGYFTTRMTSTTDYDLESRGFRLTEKLYLKDREI